MLHPADSRGRYVRIRGLKKVFHNSQDAFAARLRDQIRQLDESHSDEEGELAATQTFPPEGSSRSTSVVDDGEEAITDDL